MLYRAVRTHSIKVNKDRNSVLGKSSAIRFCLNKYLLESVTCPGEHVYSKTANKHQKLIEANDSTECKTRLKP